MSKIVDTTFTIKNGKIHYTMVDGKEGTMRINYLKGRQPVKPEMSQEELDAHIESLNKQTRATPPLFGAFSINFKAFHELPEGITDRNGYWTNATIKVNQSGDRKKTTEEVSRLMEIINIEATRSRNASIAGQNIPVEMPGEVEGYGPDMRVGQNGTLLCFREGSLIKFGSDYASQTDVNTYKIEEVAIVNAANQEGLGGGGIDGIVNNAAGGPGSNLNKDRIAMMGGMPGGKIAVGSAAFTGPRLDGYGSICAGNVIHAVGPNWRVIDGDPTQSISKVGDAYVAALDIAKTEGIKHIGFCPISAGLFRGDKKIEDVMINGIEAIAKWLRQNINEIEEIHYIMYGREEISCFKGLIREKKIPTHYS